MLASEVSRDLPGLPSGDAIPQPSYDRDHDSHPDRWSWALAQHRPRERALPNRRTTARELTGFRSSRSHWAHAEPMTGERLGLKLCRFEGEPTGRGPARGPPGCPARPSSASAGPGAAPASRPAAPNRATPPPNALRQRDVHEGLTVLPLRVRRCERQKRSPRALVAAVRLPRLRAS